jgi:hypothetical protein
MLALKSDHIKIKHQRNHFFILELLSQLARRPAIFEYITSVQNINYFVICVCKFRWFSHGTNPHTRQEDWLYSGGYWDRNFEEVHDIF